MNQMTRQLVEDFLSVTGPMVVINLPHRDDRRREFADQLKRIGLSFDNPQVRLFEAVRPTEAAGFPTLGARGCFLSHLGVLREALAAGLDGVLICEDDLDFSPDMIRRLPAITAELKRQPWGLFYGGYESPPEGEALSAGLLRVEPAQAIGCLHFYAVRGSAIADLVRYLEAVLTRPAGHPAGGLMHVDGAICHFRSDHPQYTTLAVVPPIGVQRFSRTDIHALNWYDRWPVVRSLMAPLRRLRVVRQH